jgi:hypothetical protein
MRLQPSHEEGQTKTCKVLMGGIECGGRAREAAVRQHDLLIFLAYFEQQRSKTCTSGRNKLVHHTAVRTSAQLVLDLAERGKLSGTRVAISLRAVVIIFAVFCTSGTNATFCTSKSAQPEHAQQKIENQRISKSWRLSERSQNAQQN